MKRLISRTVVTTILLAALLVSQAASAQTYFDAKSNGRQNRIVGIWDVDVIVTNCQGVEMFSFQALHQYNYGGTGQVAPNTGSLALSPHMMVWAHDHKNDYVMAFKAYRYDANGQYIGWIEVRNEVSLDDKKDGYSGSGTADIYNTAGVRVGGSCPLFEGSRFTG